MNEAADVWVLALGATLFFAVLLVTRRSWCEEPAPPVSLSPEQSQRAALVALAALEPPVVTAARPAVVLPLFPYARGRASETLVCAICLEALRDGEACSEVPGCRHVFHGDCVGAWARSKGSCPLCRARIAPGSGGAVAAADMV